jgi:tRNA U34 5-methylaminomethyl-2-thiouridine-forming methyltransferase MnmC
MKTYLVIRQPRQQYADRLKAIVYPVAAASIKEALWRVRHLPEFDPQFHPHYCAPRAFVPVVPTFV